MRKPRNPSPRLLGLAYLAPTSHQWCSTIKPILDHLYIGLNIEEIIGYSTAIVIINYLEGKK